MNEILAGRDDRRFAERKRNLCRALLGFLSEIREAKWLADEKARMALSDNEDDHSIITDDIEMQIMKECHNLSEAKKKRLLAYVSMLQNTKE